MPAIGPVAGDPPAPRYAFIPHSDRYGGPSNRFFAVVQVEDDASIASLLAGRGAPPRDRAERERKCPTTDRACGTIAKKEPGAGPGSFVTATMLDQRNLYSNSAEIVRPIGL